MEINIPFINNSDTLVNYSVLINGIGLNDTYQVVSIHILQEANAAPMAELVILKAAAAEEEWINFDAIEPGSHIEIAAGYRNSRPAQLFRGVIAKQRVDVDNGVRCTVTALEENVVQGARKLTKGPVLTVTMGDSILSFSAELSASGSQAGNKYLKGTVTFQGTPIVKPGDSIELAGTGAKFSGDVSVTAVTHIIADGEWRTTAKFER